MVELVEIVVGAVLIGGAAYVVYRELHGSKPIAKGKCSCAALRKPDYGTIPLRTDVGDWVQARPRKGEIMY